MWRRREVEVRDDWKINFDCRNEVQVLNNDEGYNEIVLKSDGEF